MTPFAAHSRWKRSYPPIPRGETVILSQAPLDENALRAAIDATGYTAGKIHAETYEKKGLFHFGKKKD